MKKRFFVPAVFLAQIWISAAHAHAMLDRAMPAPGATVHGSPGTVRMWFTEKLEPKFSGATVTGPSGQNVSGRASISGDQIIIGLPKLSAGVYRVNWRAVSVDTHRTEGSFTFEVK